MFGIQKIDDDGWHQASTPNSRMKSQHKLQQLAVTFSIALGGITSSSTIAPANALTFNFSAPVGTSPDAIAGFTQAGNLWSSAFTDDVTVNINIEFKKLAAGILGQTGATKQMFSYTEFSTALNGDQTSTDDITAVANLPNSPLKLLLNRTSNSPFGVGSATPYLDNDGNANNTTLWANTSTAKAVGLIPKNAATTDAMISFNSDFIFDFDRSNGITAGTYDFIGIATHEIGHTLGFISGVDVLDINSPLPADPANNRPNPTYFPDNAFTFVTPLDLFRYSGDSIAVNAIDWTADPRAKYLSFDAGATNIANFATGVIHGDTRQAGHFKDNLGLGIMDPTVAPGELLVITENDLRAFDAIGWDRASITTAVPEPANYLGTVVFAAVGIGALVKRRRQLAEVLPAVDLGN